MFSTEMISTSISFSSLVGISGEFPRGRGNYISTRNDSTGENFSIINLSYEDLEDAKKLGIIGDTMQAEVYGEGTDKVAFIIDERFPTICLTPEWWYGSRHQYKIQILRRKYGVPDGVCLCEFVPSRNSAIHINHYGYSQIPGFIVKDGTCTECGNSSRSVDIDRRPSLVGKIVTVKGA
ncbi:hypothetical protein [Yersinia phage fHe-Yen9-04]|uniref:Uncharacterized protein n=2 Tax=Eneladusvirus Yen904 TaxID=2560849 RepID=A0A2C9CXK0_9CAUD|nr:hypothetical protein FDJ41_gp436 [Yersinia phage fHe-Yen9-04]SOK58744.1 hypothetical protein [Yersinia phage fHe-Yen9-04]SOK59279.1 hypothetical protein [Yersinia phage fHe-Yen9-03]VUE36513.1 hypothetical protein [Yersinia phage fHe-Yen9-04]